MSFNSNESKTQLVIQEQAHFTIENYQIQVLSYLGLINPNIYYFKVRINPLIADNQKDLSSEQIGLLRVGSFSSGLQREITLRKALNNYGLIAKLLAYTQVESVAINPTLSNHEHSLDSSPENSQIQVDNCFEIRENESELESENINIKESDFLAEEYYPAEKFSINTSLESLLLLTEFPQDRLSLEKYLNSQPSIIEALSLIIQICQFCSYLYQQQWCLVNLSPQFIEFDKRLKFFDLTGLYPINETPTSGLLGDYCAPELASDCSINQLMSSYTIGVLLYQIIHHQLPNNDLNFNLEINPIPRVYQLLKILLSPIPEERFPLSQLRQLLLETRTSFTRYKINWNLASNSTIGLALERLQNEDNYGIKQQQLSNKETLLIGLVADGMGGMAQGEIASQIAVKTFLEEPIPAEFKTLESANNWLLNVFQKANQSITEIVKDGGTTLSAVLAINHQLMTAHVGDSRIYLLRQGQIQQLTQDHSLVNLLVTSGEITEEESLTYPERNVLLKSLGSTNYLANGYVETLKETTENLFINLENKDIIILCSDGVWNLISHEAFRELFNNNNDLQTNVDNIIQKVLEQGAPDNATLVALQCFINLIN